MSPNFTPDAPRFSIGEGAALALAVAAHVGVVALLVMRPAAPPPAPPARMEVTLADDVGLQSSAPSHAPAAADLAPVLGAAQPEAAAPEPAPVAKPVHHEVVAAPVPLPLPRTRPVLHSEPTHPATTAPAKPHTHEAADPVAAALAGSAAASHKAHQPAGGSRIGADFLKGVSSANTNGKANAAPAVITGQQKAALASAISRQLKPFWVAPQGVDADQLVTILSFDLNQDGTLASEPRVVRQEGINDSNRAQAARHAEQAKKAVRQAAQQHFLLPPDLYSSWRHIPNARFDWTLSQ